MRKLFAACILLCSVAAHAQTGSFGCNMLEAITTNAEAFPRIGKQQKIVLIDTFKLFTPACSGTYGGRKIEVLNKMPEKIEPEMFAVSNINTSKSEGFIISILQIATRHAVGYSISISKQDFVITKTSIGDF